MLRRIVCAVLFLTAIGCSIDSAPSADPKGTSGLVEIRLAKAQSRTLLPQTADLYYTLTFTEQGEDGEIVKRYITPGDEESQTISLKIGTWKLEVKGYLEQGAETHVVTGSHDSDITIAGGETISITIELKSASNAAGIGKFEITLPVSTRQATLKWTRIGEEGEPKVVNLLGAEYVDAETHISQGIVSLPGGYYRVLLIAKMADGSAAGRHETAHILNGLTTLVEWTLEEDDFAEKPNKDELINKIATAGSQKKGVETDTNAGNVNLGTQWVTEAVASAFDEVITAAEAIVDKEDADLDEVITAIEELEKAIEVYEKAKSDGTKPVSKTALNESLTEARKLELTAKYTDETTPDQVAKDLEFVTESVMTALSEAIKTAEAVADAEDIYQPAVDAALARLNEAIETFKKEVQTGTNENIAIVDKTSLNTAIANAVEAARDVHTATEDTANRVPEGSYWVTADERAVFDAAIAEATRVSQSGEATADAVSSAKTTLETAIETFTSAKKAGTQKEVTVTLSVNGSETETTTKLTLTFDKAVEGLTVDDITLTGSVSATKGELTVQDNGAKYELGVTLASGGNIGARVAKTGYSFSTPDAVTVSYFTGGGITIELGTLTDLGAEITGSLDQDISRSGGDTVTFTVQAESVQWYVEGDVKTGTTSEGTTTLTLNAADYTVGVHHVTAVVTIEGKRYAQEASFGVTN